MIFYSDANKAHFHTNGSTLSLVFKPRFLFNMLAITAEIAERICPMLGNPRQSWILDSGFWILDSTPWIPDSSYWIPIFVNGNTIPDPKICRIPDSLSYIPDSKTQDSGFHKQIFPDSGFHKQKFLAFRRNPLHEAQGFFLMFRYTDEAISRQIKNK